MIALDTNLLIYACDKADPTEDMAERLPGGAHQTGQGAGIETDDKSPASWARKKAIGCSPPSAQRLRSGSIND